MPLAKSAGGHGEADSNAWYPLRSTLTAAVTSSLLLVLLASYAAPHSAYGASTGVPESSGPARSATPAGPPPDTPPSSSDGGPGRVTGPEEPGARGITGPDEPPSPIREAPGDGKGSPAVQVPGGTKVGSDPATSQAASPEVGRLSTSVQSLDRLLPEDSSPDEGERAAGAPLEARSAPREPASGVGGRVALALVLSGVLLGGLATRVLRRRTVHAGFGGSVRTSAARPL